MVDYTPSALGAVLGGFLASGVIVGLLFGAVGVYLRSRW